MPELSKEGLLRKYEPVIRCTAGERFFPTDVNPYVERAGLWVRKRSRPSRCIIPPGELRLDRLAEAPKIGREEVQFLRFSIPLSAKDLAAYTLKEKRRKKEEREIFHAGPGRLARVGYTSRLIDAIFSIALLARGRVPGDLATAAAIAYRDIREDEKKCKYYGRVMVQDGWVVLQYWFFYTFNDWRSRFFGTNDHEADWEMVSVFLDESAPGEPAPEWVVYSCHEYDALDLRRRWDDPELEKEGDHPVVYAGAGSHASYFRPGEYLAEIEIPLIRPVVRLVDGVRGVWHEKLRQYGAPEREEEEVKKAPLFRVPFVDYARGDGFTIGPGGDIPWDDPGILSPPPPWASGYRGLWGYYAMDPLAGENAPSGPVYNRDGTVRQAWNDPVGWCGLAGEPPPSHALAAAADLRADIDRRRRGRLEKAEEGRRELVRLQVEQRSVAGRPHLKPHALALQETADRLAAQIEGLRGAIAIDKAAEEELDHLAARLRRGEKGPGRTHLRHPQRPLTADELRTGRLAEIWAAVSVGLMLLGVVALFIFAREYLVLGLLGLLFWFLTIEVTFRGKLTQLVATCTLLLAIFSLGILLTKFFMPIALGLVCLLGAYILRENLRELWS